MDSSAHSKFFEQTKQKIDDIFLLHLEPVTTPLENLQTIINKAFLTAQNNFCLSSDTQYLDDLRNKILCIAEQLFGQKSQWRYIRKILLDILGDRGLIGQLRKSEHLQVETPRTKASNLDK